jgi:mgtE-like transporter
MIKMKEMTKMNLRRLTRQAYFEGLPALVLSSFGGIIAGLILGGMKTELQAIPGLLVLIPALLAIRGNVYGSLGARISTGLHQGLIEPKISFSDHRVNAAVFASFINALFAAAIGAIFAYFLLTFLFEPVAPLRILLSIALIAGIFSGLVLITAVISVIFAAYRNGLNPDTIVGPLVATIGDIFGLLFLLLAVRIIMGGWLI